MLGLILYGIGALLFWYVDRVALLNKNISTHFYPGRAVILGLLVASVVLHLSLVLALELWRQLLIHTWRSADLQRYVTVIMTA